MSILAGKNALIVCDDEHPFEQLTILLKKHGMNCLEMKCAEVTPGIVAEHGINVIILSHICKNELCCGLISILGSDDLSRTVPVLVLVSNDEKEIADALMHGAADYLTENEEPLAALKKIKMILGQPDTLSSPLIFDVPPDPALTTKKGVKVYVIEDDPLLRNLLTARLETSSFQHEFAADGNDVIAKMVNFRPQVIILDLMLPGKSGFEVLEEIKETQELRSVPVIIFSNRDSQEDKQRVLSLGIDRFFVKALTDLSALVETIEELAA